VNYGDNKNFYLQDVLKAELKGRQDKEKEFKVLLNPLITLLNRIDRGDYFNEDDKELK